MKVHAGMLFLSITLAGCATTPADHSKARQVPADRLMGFQSAVDAPNGTLVLTRDKGLLVLAVITGSTLTKSLPPESTTPKRRLLLCPPGN